MRQAAEGLAHARNQGLCIGILSPRKGMMMIKNGHAHLLSTSLRPYRVLFACILLVNLLSIIPVPFAHAAVTLFVALDGNDSNDCLALDQACRTIGAAITKAADGDTIRILQGTYTENIVIDKRLTLIGAGQANTIIDGGQSRSC